MANLEAIEQERSLGCDLHQAGFFATPKGGAPLSGPSVRTSLRQET